MKTSEMINEISKAISLAQGEMRPASKSTVNPFFKSKYSTLAQVWDVIREPVAKNNLTILQDVSSTEHGIAISTRICHASGQWIEFGPLEIPLNKKDAQSVGSATSYGKRYALSAAIGVVSEEDDDGEAAMGRKEEKKKELPKTVNKAQWTELNQLIDQCDSEFQQKMWDYLTSQGITSFAEMDEAMFNKLRKGCVANISTQKVEHALSQP
jgi:hypothetical protein